MGVTIEIPAVPGTHRATVVGETGDGRRILDLDGGPLLVEGRDCTVIRSDDTTTD